MSDFDRTKWDAKYADPQFAPREPSAVLVSLSEFLPARGKAIDVAGGAGRNAIWLAQRGLDATIVDVSAVGLAQAAARATEAGEMLTTICTDLESQPFPAGPWDLIVSCRYLQRPLFSVFPQVLAPGGTLIVIQPTKKNLERHEKPPADFLLEDGELPGLIQGLKVVHYEEGWLADDRHDAVIVATNPRR